MSVGAVGLAAVVGVWVSIGIVLSIAMGRRGHAPIPWLVLGSVAARLARGTAVPTLLVSGPASAEQ